MRQRVTLRACQSAGARDAPQLRHRSETAGAGKSSPRYAAPADVALKGPDTCNVGRAVNLQAKRMPTQRMTSPMRPDTVSLSSRIGEAIPIQASLARTSPVIGT